MELQPVTPEDVLLYQRIHCDPEMMQHLGGPFPKEEAPQILKRALAHVENGGAWLFKVMAHRDFPPAGTVCIWQSEHQGEPIHEMGWTILPSYQGRGLATQAVQALLDKAQTEGRWGPIHAFPATSNAPSNAMCKKMGFTLLEECDLDYSGRALRCNHWKLNRK